MPTSPLKKNSTTITKLCAKADAALAKQAYDEAKNAYNQALTIKPNEAYPKQKIAEIDKILADKAAKEKLDNDYKAAIAKADAALAKQAYDEAKNAYNQALTIKPNEAYPKQKIAEIDKILADKAAKEKLDNDYKVAIAKADAAL